MNIEEYSKYCLSKKGTTESIPFSKQSKVPVFKVLGKVFTATDINNYSFSDQLLYNWLDISYNLVVATLSKKMQEEILK